MTTAANRLPFYASLVAWPGAAVLFFLPAVAMQVTPEVTWTMADFAAWGAMLLTTAAGFEFLSRRAPNRTYRAGAAVAVIASFFLIWVNLAVGIIGSEDNPANRMYAGVLAVAVGGACLARLRARSMARAMLTTACAQVLVGVIALIFALGTDGRAWPRDVIGVTVLMSAMWLASAMFFRRSSAG